MDAGEWTWLAAAEVFGRVITPIVVVVIGYMLSRRLGALQKSTERRDRISEKRMELYDLVGFQLNDLYAYYMFIGLWKELSPADVIDRKRQLDRTVYTYEPLFSEHFFECYQALMEAMFSVHGDWGTDAKLRTEGARRPNLSGLPEAERLTRFTEEDNREAIKAAYRVLMKALAEELDLTAAVKG